MRPKRDGKPAAPRTELHVAPPSLLSHTSPGLPPVQFTVTLGSLVASEVPASKPPPGSGGRQPTKKACTPDTAKRPEPKSTSLHVASINSSLVPAFGRSTGVHVAPASVDRNRPTSVETRTMFELPS